MSYYDQAKDNPKERYCISCGRKGVQWPKTDPTGVTNYKATPLACSWRCLANRVISEYMVGQDGLHCNDCGNWTDSDHCQEPEDGPRTPMGYDALLGRNDEEEDS